MICQMMENRVSIQEINGIVWYRDQIWNDVFVQSQSTWESKFAEFQLWFARGDNETVFQKNGKKV